MSGWLLPSLHANQAHQLFNSCQKSASDGMWRIFSWEDFDRYVYLRTWRPVCKCRPSSHVSILVHSHIQILIKFMYDVVMTESEAFQKTKMSRKIEPSTFGSIDGGLNLWFWKNKLRQIRHKKYYRKHIKFVVLFKNSMKLEYFSGMWATFWFKTTSLVQNNFNWYHRNRRLMNHQRFAKTPRLAGTMFAEWCGNGNKLFSADFNGRLFSFA